MRKVISKKITKLLAFLMLVICLGVTLGSCGDEPDPVGPGPDPVEHTHKDENGDCLCDANDGYDFHNEIEYFATHCESGVCDVCGRNVGLVEQTYAYVDPATCKHVDADKNCVCDFCFTGMDHKFDANGKCTVCNNTKRKVGNYTYNSSFVTSPSCWNPHTYKDTDNGDVYDMITSGLYGFFFNGDKSGYEIWPEMAAAYPEDVTEEVKNMSYNFGIPADATEHYAYKIRLNKNATWEDGTKIKAADWVESYELLMRPDLMNYRAADQMSGNVVVAGCKDYYYQGTTAYLENAAEDAYNKSDLVKGADGVYYTPAGDKVSIGVDFPLAWTSGNTLADYVYYYGTAYFAVETWEDLMALVDENGLVPLTDESYELFLPVITGNSSWGETEADAFNYLVVTHEFEADFSFSKVGMFVDPNDEYAFYMVLAKPAFGFYYIYGLSSWLVKVDAYKAGLTTNATTGVTTTNYNTSVETTHCTGPYKLSLFQIDKEIDYVRNDNWFGYKDSRFDCLYQTSAVVQQYITESSTRKEMFLKGELISYGLQPADYSEYGQSNYFYSSPGSTLFFMILSANEEVLASLEQSLTNENKTIICNEDFRHAMSLAFNKQEFSQALSPARTPAFSVVGAYDIWNPTTGEKYRDTQIAKEAIVEFYGYEKVGDNQYKIAGSDMVYTLDQANDAINGYSPDVAKILFDKAYDAWLEAGKIGANDKVTITYASSGSSDFQTKLLNELNRQLSRTLEGTKLEGRVEFNESAPLGDNWSDSLKSSESQTCLAGWNGGMLDPFNSMLYYLEPNHQPYAAAWWHTESTNLTLTLPVGENGADVELTTTLANWSLILTGETKKINGVDYNFGYAQVDDDVRLTILAAFEKAILGTDYYIPFMQDASGFLLSQKVNYALGRNDYNAVLGRGGITYMTYNYDDAAWTAYIASQGGSLKY